MKCCPRFASTGEWRARCVISTHRCDSRNTGWVLWQRLLYVGEVTNASPTPDPPDDPELIPAATVVLLRDGANGVETAMLRRNSKIAFGGAWVFPGGRVDDDENDPDDVLGSARRAAAREVEEETGLVIDANDLVPWSYWIPPKMAAMTTPGPRRRFSTWFFGIRTPSDDILIDDGEIKDHEWMSPEVATAKRDAGEIELVPPTFVTLQQLAVHADVDAALAWAAGRAPERFETRPLPGKPMMISWDGDVAYESGDREADGPRHRLVMTEGAWSYERA